MTAWRQFRPQALLQLLSLCLTTGACFFLIPTRGVIGASIALALGAFANFAGSALIVLGGMNKLEDAAG
jgi:O-antigen/teichoic acid export membrane protein